MDVILAVVKWQTALVYPDDTMIISTAPEKRIGYVKQVLNLMLKGVTLGLKKGRFFSITIDYLGHVSGPGNL